MTTRTTQCGRHGTQGIGLACAHVVHALRERTSVGLFWGDDTETARPDAWCDACEDALVALRGGSSEPWFLDAGFEILCAACWDEAKRIYLDTSASP